MERRLLSKLARFGKGGIRDGGAIQWHTDHWFRGRGELE